VSAVLVEEAPPRPVAQGRERALESVVVAAWAQVTARGLATCPVCGDALAAQLAPGRAGVMSSCGGCGSELR
jgi:hypothetical protein